MVKTDVQAATILAVADLSHHVGTLRTKIVGIRYYTGHATTGEFVIIRREPSNPVGIWVRFFRSCLLIALLSSTPMLSAWRMSRETRLETSRAKWLQSSVLTWYGRLLNPLALLIAPW